MGRGHAGTAFERNTVGNRCGGATITEGINDQTVIAADGAVGARCAAAPTGCADTGFRADVGVVGIVAVQHMGCNGNHATAIGWLTDCVIAAIAAGNDHDGADCIDIINRTLEGCRTMACTTQAEVDDARRILIMRRARHINAGGPAHGIDDVGGIATAFPQRPHWEQTHVGGNAGAVESVVHQRGNNAGDMGAMPA